MYQAPTMPQTLYHEPLINRQSTISTPSKLQSSKKEKLNKHVQ